ncbi:MAG: queuosine precursor transporter [Propionibacteriaceae bacterium]|nr:queuosine precursor transporter [Propionibacteriaceae bacterium]
MTPADTLPRRGNYDLILALFCAFLLISNIAATKLIQVGPDWSPGGIALLPVIADGGAFLFPLTYVLGDILAEVYGFRLTRRAIWTGFACSIVASLTFLAVTHAPPAADWPNQAGFEAVLGFVPRIVAASLLGYLAGQFLNAWVLVRLKERTGQRRLWARLIGSTVVGEFADTAIFCVVAFGGIVGGGTLLNYILVGYLYKTLVEIMLLPLTYRVIALVRRHEPGP